MPKITIDGIELEVAEGTTVLRAALDNGIFIPHYCYHPALSVAGNCRMCVVELKGSGKPEISCNLKAADGMVIFTDSEMVRDARKSALEFLLINHPLDCPVCDQAGECILQDYYFDYSLEKSRMREAKVKGAKAKDIGRHIMLDNERCILCTRCVRFLNEKTFTNELTVDERGDRSVITTFPGIPVDNPYSMNIVDICPVGALTSKDFRFKKRVWFLKSAPSVCAGCATGCNIWIDHADGVIYRYRARENPHLMKNDWLCDEGRLSYKRINDGRLLEPVSIENGKPRKAAWESVLRKLSAEIGRTPKEDILLALSAERSNEETDAWYSWAKENGISKVFAVGREVKDASEDHWLIHADKNPNHMKLTQLGCERLIAMPEVRLAIFMQTPPQGLMEHLKEMRPQFTAIMTPNECEGPACGDLLLPLATHTEQDGSFTNVHGAVQKFRAAYPPKGEARSAVWILDELKKIR